GSPAGSGSIPAPGAVPVAGACPASPYPLAGIAGPPPAACSSVGAGPSTAPKATHQPAAAATTTAAMIQAVRAGNRRTITTPLRMSAGIYAAGRRPVGPCAEARTALH